MDERVLYFRVGVVVVASVTITIVLVMLFGAWPNVLESRYPVHIKFPEAPGVTVDTPVRKSGVLIGRVTEVRLLDEGGVQVSADINAKYKLRQNESCRISSGSLFGDAVLEFVPSNRKKLLARFDANKDGRLDSAEKKRSNELVGDELYILEGDAPRSPLRILVDLEDDISATLHSIQTAGDGVAQLTNSVNRTMGGEEGQIGTLAKKAETALDRFDRTMQAVEKVLGDEETSAKLRQSLDELPEFIRETRETMITARSTLQDFKRVSQKAESNLENLEQFTEPLGKRGSQLIDNVDASTRNLNELLAQLVAFSEGLNSGQGTLSKLVHDDELYGKIDRLMTNVEDLSRRLRPILDDVRTFTDKIARDPRQLGLKGMVDPRPTGLKTGLNAGMHW